MTFKKTLIGIPLAGALLFGQANAQHKISAEAIKSEKENSSYFRGNANYNLPSDVKGYTFGEFYSNGDSYFSKTTLSKAVYDRFGVQAQAVIGSGLTDRLSIGPNAVLPTPEGTFAKMYWMPTWITAEKGRKVSNRSMLGYFVSADLPLDFTASSFGELNIAGKNGAEWGYGEISLGRKLADKLTLSYNPALKNRGSGEAMPQLEHRINLIYEF